jgi:hypothetical protein
VHREEYGMKTTYKVKRGHVWHVVHETKTGQARVSAYTLCGSNYEHGERSTRQPTCPNCCKLDNPLTLTSEERVILKDAARINRWQDAPRHSRAFQRLVQVDYITPDAQLTRRGLILMEDYDLGPVPLADLSGLVHSRVALGGTQACDHMRHLADADKMTTERYAKLRKISDQVMVTCIQCIAHEDLR